jgi:hypothetical protein
MGPGVRRDDVYMASPLHGMASLLLNNSFPTVLDNIPVMGHMGATFRNTGSGS